MSNLKWEQTPYGFKEAEYRGCVITVINGEYFPKGTTFSYCGDQIYADSVKDAMAKIDRIVDGAKEMPSRDEILEWISEHETLAEDFEAHFGVKPYED